MSDDGTTNVLYLGAAVIAERISKLFEKHLADVHPHEGAMALAFLAGSSVVNLDPEEREQMVRGLCSVLVHAARKGRAAKYN